MRAACGRINLVGTDLQPVLVVIKGARGRCRLPEADLRKAIQRFGRRHSPVPAGHRVAVRRGQRRAEPDIQQERFLQHERVSRPALSRTGAPFYAAAARGSADRARIGIPGLRNARARRSDSFPKTQSARHEPDVASTMAPV